MGEQKVPFEILDTDYDKYLVILMCKDDSFYLRRMKSALTLLRRKDMKQEELNYVSEKVEMALRKSNLQREDLGLSHTPTYKEDSEKCESVDFPKAISDGKITVTDTATINGVAAHALSAVEDADSLAKDAEDPAIDRKDLAKRMKEHANDVKAIAKDVKDLSSL